MTVLEEEVVERKKKAGSRAYKVEDSFMSGIRGRGQTGG
jgi:hypothetical protein